MHSPPPLRLLLHAPSGQPPETLIRHLEDGGGSWCYESLADPAALGTAANQQTWDALVVWCDPASPATHALLARFAARLPVILVANLAPEEMVADAIRSGASAVLSAARWSRIGPVVQSAVSRRLREVEGKLLRKALEEDDAIHPSAVATAQWEESISSGAMEWSGGMDHFLGQTAGPEPVAQTTLQLRLRTQDRLRREDALRLLREEGHPLCLHYTLIRPDGAEEKVRERAHRILLPGTGEVVLVGVIQDFTQLDELSSQLLHARKMELLGRVVGGFAHDFNNIITVLRGYSEVILSLPDLDPVLAKHVRQLANSSERAMVLTQQLHAFGRRGVCELKLADLNVAIREAQILVRRVVREEAKVVLELDPTLPRIQTDVRLIEQLMVTLGLHIRFRLPKGGSLVLSTRLYTSTPANPQVEFWIGGRAPNTPVTPIYSGSAPLQQIQVSPSIADADLAAAAEIARQLHARLDVAGNSPEPPIFRVVLGPPSQPAPTPANPEPGGAAHKLRSAPPARGTILVVEDDEAVAEAIASVLRTRDFEIVIVGRASDALVAWEQRGGEIDLLFADIVLPGGMSGQELSEVLIARKPSLKTIFSSGYALESLPGPSVFIPGVNYLPKPIAPLAMIELVEKLLT